MICSSVNRLGFMSIPFRVMDFTHFRRSYRGSAQIHASENVAAAREKAVRVIEKLRGLRLNRAAELTETAVEETLTYYAFPEEHWATHPYQQPSPPRPIQDKVLLAISESVCAPTQCIIRGVRVLVEVPASGRVLRKTPASKNADI